MKNDSCLAESNLTCCLRSLYRKCAERNNCRWFSPKMSFSLTSCLISSIAQHYQLRNRKHVPCFCRVRETQVEVWENEKCCGNTSRQASVSSLEIPRRRKESSLNCLLWSLKCKFITSTARARAVFLSSFGRILLKRHYCKCCNLIG